VAGGAFAAAGTEMPGVGEGHGGGVGFSPPSG
jgi:hypothetical protein